MRVHRVRGGRHGQMWFGASIFRGEDTVEEASQLSFYHIPAKELINPALNYHRWPICEATRLCGKAGKISVLDFAKTR